MRRKLASLALILTFVSMGSRPAITQERPPEEVLDRAVPYGYKAEEIWRIEHGFSESADRASFAEAQAQADRNRYYDEERKSGERHRAIDSSKITFVNLVDNSATEEAVMKSSFLSRARQYLAVHDEQGMLRLLRNNRGKVLFIVAHNHRGDIVTTDVAGRRRGKPIGLRWLDTEAKRIGTFPIVLSCYASSFVRAGTARSVNSVDMVGLIDEVLKALASGRLADELRFGSFFMQGMKIEPTYLRQMSDAITSEVRTYDDHVVAVLYVRSCVLKGSCELLPSLLYGYIEGPPTELIHQRAPLNFSCKSDPFLDRQPLKGCTPLIPDPFFRFTSPRFNLGMDSKMPAKAPITSVFQP